MAAEPGTPAGGGRGEDKRSWALPSAFQYLKRNFINRRETDFLHYLMVTGQEKQALYTAVLHLQLQEIT